LGRQETPQPPHSAEIPNEIVPRRGESLGNEAAILVYANRRSHGPAFRSAVCPLLRLLPLEADGNRDRKGYCDRNGQRQKHTLPPFRPNVV
jgi:hypothetical protein